jgi:hypothetical protein
MRERESCYLMKVHEVWLGFVESVSIFKTDKTFHMTGQIISEGK